MKEKKVDAYLMHRLISVSSRRTFRTLFGERDLIIFIWKKEYTRECRRCSRQIPRLIKFILKLDVVHLTHTCCH